MLHYIFVHLHCGRCYKVDPWADVIKWHEFSSQGERLSATLTSASSIRSRWGCEVKSSFLFVISWMRTLSWRTKIQSSPPLSQHDTMTSHPCRDRQRDYTVTMVVSNPASKHVSWSVAILAKLLLRNALLIIFSGIVPLFHVHKTLQDLGVKFLCLCLMHLIASLIKFNMQKCIEIYGNLWNLISLYILPCGACV